MMNVTQLTHSNRNNPSDNRATLSNSSRRFPSQEPKIQRKSTITVSPAANNPQKRLSAKFIVVGQSRKNPAASQSASRIRWDYVFDISGEDGAPGINPF